MSSYLNIYLVPYKKGKDKQEPLLFTCYSRSSEVYQAFCKTLNPAYIGSENTPKYSELTEADAKRVVEEVEYNLEQSKNKLEYMVEFYKEVMSEKIPKEAFEEYKELREYIEQLKSTLITVKGIHEWVSGIGDSDFEKVLINID